MEMQSAAAAENTAAALDTGVMRADAGPEAETADRDPGGEFEKLIQGPYKAEYDARMRSAIQARLKNSRETVEKYHAWEPTIALLEKKYGVAPGDMEALGRAIREEQTTDPASAPAQPDAAALKGAARIYDDWMEQARQLRQLYPQLDMARELESPRFAQLLRSGVDVRTAYEVMHQAEILPAAMEYAARTVEQQLAGSLRSSALRPAENGAGNQTAAAPGSSVAGMTAGEIAEICRRVQRGERISFG